MVRSLFIRQLGLDEKKKSIIWDFMEEILFHNELAIFFRKVYRFILRLIRWIPVLWDQEEWDYAYIYPLLITKMKELKKNMSEDYWHDQKEIQRRIKQIDICMARLDRYLNWHEYYEYPMEDIYYEPTEDGCSRMCYASKKNEKQRLGALDFEEKNFQKFWKNFVKWHRGWWT